jgi:hypothetical protein
MFDLHKGNGVEIVKGLGLSRDCRFIFDPPYGNGSYETDKELPMDFYRWLIDNFQTVAFFGYPEKLVSICVRIQVIPNEWVTWHPLNKTAGRSKDYLPKEAECIAIFGDMPNPTEITRKRVKKGTAITAIHKSRGSSPVLARLGDVWNDASPGMAFLHHLRQHPNEKPVSLMTKLVTLCSNEGDTVVDPTMGSGTTGEASLYLGRSFVGCELVPEHFEKASKRVQSAALSPSFNTLPNNRLHLDVGDSPAQKDLFTLEAGSAAGKSPKPAPRR